MGRDERRRCRRHRSHPGLRVGGAKVSGAWIIVGSCEGMKQWVSGVGCRVSGVGCRVSGVRCRVEPCSQRIERSFHMKSFRELRVWQAAMDLVEKIYSLTRNFPREETY